MRFCPILGLAFLAFTIATAVGQDDISSVGWASLRWGMAPKEVVDAYAGLELLDGRGTSETFGLDDTYWIRVSGAMPLGGASYTAGFMFKDSTGLRRIRLEPSKYRDCDKLLSSALSLLGPGRDVKDSYGTRYVIWDPDDSRQEHVQLTDINLIESCGLLISSPAPAVTQALPAEYDEPAIVDLGNGKSGIGDWIITEDKSPFDDSPEIFAVLTSDTVTGGGIGEPTLQLALRCSENLTNVLIPTSLFMADEPEVTYRLDQNDPVVSKMGVATNYQVTGLWIGGTAIPFIRSLREARTLALRVQSDDRVEAVFNLDGVRTVSSMVAAACNWSP